MTVRKTQSKRKQSRRQIWWFTWPHQLILGSLAIASGITGAATAYVLQMAPLQAHKVRSHLPHATPSITSMIPGRLTRPINVLILGIDNSGHPHEGSVTPAEALAGNSDTMLLVRIDPTLHQVNVLSIPRDTMVQIPKVGNDKINDANVQGGVTLVAQSVSQLLQGVQIDRYVRVDTEGFVHLIDAIGGLEVNVPKPMNYVDRSQNLSIHFAAGKQYLNGQHLQEYVRYRHDEWGDIGRVQRQQEVLSALLQRIIQPQTITKIPKILQVAQQNVDTDLSLEEMLALSQTLRSLNRQQMSCVMLPGRFSRRDEYYLSYWISDPETTKPIMARYFNVAASDNGTDNASSAQIKIAIVNATNQPGLSQSLVDLLHQQGFNNVYVSDHEISSNLETDDRTQIVAEHGNPDAAERVRTALNATRTSASTVIGHVQVASIGDLSSDVTIFIGSDFNTLN